MVDWTAVETAAISAAEGVLGRSWRAVQNGVIPQIEALTGVAKYIEDHKAEMSEAEYTQLAEEQKSVMKNVLLGYEAIGIATAQNVVATVVSEILKAVPALVGFL